VRERDYKNLMNLVERSEKSFLYVLFGLRLGDKVVEHLELDKILGFKCLHGTTNLEESMRFMIDALLHVYFLLLESLKDILSEILGDLLEEITIGLNTR
jgi:hypothetical protein